MVNHEGKEVAFVMQAVSRTPKRPAQKKKGNQKSMLYKAMYFRVIM
jgi:hypothetical protein